MARACEQCGIHGAGYQTAGDEVLDLCPHCYGPPYDDEPCTVLRMKVKMLGPSTAMMPWSWNCPCCVNTPGMAGYPTPSAARYGAIEHAKLVHPATDLDSELKGLLDG